VIATPERNEGVDGQVSESHDRRERAGVWAALQRGEFITDAAVAAGTHRKQGTRWVIANGGVRPRRGRNLKGRCLTFADREEIAMRRAAGASVRSIAAFLGT
jgi:transposase, IS30 family